MTQDWYKAVAKPAATAKVGLTYETLYLLSPKGGMAFYPEHIQPTLQEA